MRHRLVTLVALTLALQYTHVARGQELGDLKGPSAELGEAWHGAASSHTEAEAWLARERWQRVEEEQRTRPTLEWAGRYVAPHGGTGQMSFVWAPATGFVAAWVGCAPGVHETSYGDVTVSADRIRLAPDRAAARRWSRSLGAELVFVRWGEQRYLVPSEHVATFCRYAAGLEPNPGLEEGFPFLVHVDDAKRPAEGLPVVPKEFARDVLAPVDATVLSVLSARPWPVAPCDECEPSVSLVTRVVIDAGAVDGVAEGTRLRIEGDGCYEEFVVVRVGRDACEAEMVWPLDEEGAPYVVCDEGAVRPDIGVGLRVTSRR